MRIIGTSVSLGLAREVLVADKNLQHKLLVVKSRDITAPGVLE